MSPDGCQRKRRRPSLPPIDGTLDGVQTSEPRRGRRRLRRVRSPRSSPPGTSAVPEHATRSPFRNGSPTLEAVHEQGIIHRDLKPANIKVRADDTVKVLDFELAKGVEPTSAEGGSPTISPMISMHVTKAGVILGTAAYMSPDPFTSTARPGSINYAPRFD
jgi:serine/threonine protein kinase